MTAAKPAPAQTLDCGGRAVDLSVPRVMGVLNVTPDSFSDGGHYASLDASLRHAAAMVAAGASFIDVGGESTRPGASEVSVEEELDRVIPVVEAIRRELDVVISLDTSKPEVMRAGVRAGAGLINDVRALRQPGALEAASASGLPVCLMHIQGQPRTMQQAPAYRDVLAEVTDFLRGRIEACTAAGIESARLILDPGFGFGKTAEHNLQLLNRLDQIAALGYPVLAGLSRKSLLGAVTGRPVDERLAASAVAAALAVVKGASIIRAHDVPATVDAVRLARAMIRETADD